jgi:thymidylate kinase
MPVRDTADMRIVCIESNDLLLRDQTVNEVAHKLRSQGIRVRIAAFPGDGPFAHQIRVALDQRTQYHDLPWHGLYLVDRMDFFFNPTNGLSQNADKFDYLLISGSHYYEYLQSDNEELSSWILSINDVLPQPQLVLWISTTESDQAYDRLISILPSAHRFVPTPSSDMVDAICYYLKAEGHHE